MAAGKPERTIRASGRIVVGPTDLSVAYPYGGTEVGRTRACVLLPLGVPTIVRDEGLGEPIDVLEGDNRYAFSCFLRGLDDDALAQLFPGGYSAGAVTKHAVWAEPGTRVPGQSALDRALKVLYVPDDLVNNSALLLYRAIPDWVEGAEVFFTKADELGLPVAMECLRDASDRILQLGRLPDLTL